MLLLLMYLTVFFRERNLLRCHHLTEIPHSDLVVTQQQFLIVKERCEILLKDIQKANK